MTIQENFRTLTEINKEIARLSKELANLRKKAKTINKEITEKQRLASIDNEIEQNKKNEKKNENMKTMKEK